MFAQATTPGELEVVPWERSVGPTLGSIRHHTRPRYGMQAHVEFGPHGQQILRQFLDLAAHHRPEPRKDQR